MNRRSAPFRRLPGWIVAAALAVLVAGAMLRPAVAPAATPEAHAAGEAQAAPPPPHAAEAPAGHEAPATPEAHAAGEAGGHGATSTEEAIHTAESSSFVDLILKAMGYKAPHEGQHDTNPGPLALLAMFQIPIISIIVILLLASVIMAGAKRRDMIPGPLQNFVEMVVGALADFVDGVLGVHGRQFVPFLGTLFLYILVSNLIGILPLFKSPTSSYNTTLALALIVFFYVQYTGIRANGLGGYLFHLAGEPRDVIGWSMTPLMFPLHIIGELAKPLSLSLRLFGNIFGEETLIAVFVGLGVVALSFTHLPIGIPFQVPFLALALLTGTIQALVFTLLSTIYFGLMLPHHEHQEEEPGARHHH